MRNASHVFTRTRLVAVAIATLLVAFAPARPATADPPAFDDGAGAPTIGKFNPVTLNGTGPDCSIGATSAIPGANVSMNAPVVNAADAQTDMTGVTAAGFTGFTTPKTIISAAAGDGGGTYDVAPRLLKLIVPANVLVGDYCTSATIAITSGP